MAPELILVFFVVFAGAMTAAFVGLKFYEQRRRRQLSTALKTIGGDPPRAETKILKDLPGEDRRPVGGRPAPVRSRLDGGTAAHHDGGGGGRRDHRRQPLSGRSAGAAACPG